MKELDRVRMLLGHDNWVGHSAGRYVRPLAESRGPGRTHTGVLCRPAGVARPFRTAGSSVVPATSPGVAEGGGGGCSSEFGFCGTSGKSGGRVGGVTGAGAGRGL
jgi:hypothetical protein